TLIPETLSLTLELEPTVRAQREASSVLARRRGLIAHDEVAIDPVCQLHDLALVAEVDLVFQATVRAELHGYVFRVARILRLNQQPPTDQRRCHHPSPFVLPNGLRLSGERSRAKRVRCSRGLGAGFTAAISPAIEAHLDPIEKRCNQNKVQRPRGDEQRGWDD